MNYQRRIHPFHDSELRIVIFNRENALKKKIDQLTDDEILANDENILADNLYEEFRFIPVEIRDEDASRRKMSTQKITVVNQFRVFQGEPQYFEVDGVVIDLCIPFVGDEILFQCKASTFSLSPYPDINPTPAEQKFFHCAFAARGSQRLENRPADPGCVPPCRGL